METYKQTFDLVICNDSDLGFVLELVKYIVEEDNFPSLKEEEDQAEEDYIVVPPSLGYSVCWIATMKIGAIWAIVSMSLHHSQPSVVS